MTLRQITNINHQLELFGPRNIAFRPATDEFLRPAAKLANGGNIAAALDAAEEAYITHHGNMHGVSFRIRTTSETLSGHGAVEEILDGCEGQR